MVKIISKFTELLRTKADSIWNTILNHQFLVDMSEGTLPLERFRYYVRQDYVYLIEFARCLSLAVAKTDDTEIMRALVSLLEGCLTVEMDMLSDLAKKISLSKKDLVKSQASPTSKGYTRHLLYIAYSGTLGEIIASLLPCMWTYQDIGESLIHSDAMKDKKVYFGWAKTYTSSEYIELVDGYKELTNRFFSQSGKYVREKMKDHFMASIRYEYMFWDMAYTMEEWPV
ncbi:MAG: thiaminase II [Candidatus Bathyarchaeia archaeon]